MAADVQRWAAFTTDPAGGNPAGVVLDARGLDEAEQQRIAREVGFSETAFVVPRPDGELDVRYFSPEAEVPFCGHATIALGVATAERDGPGELALHTASGLVRVVTRTGTDGTTTATLTSVTPAVEEVAPGDLERALAALRWAAGELDPDLPPRIAFAGARHLVLAAATRERLAALDYDFDALRAFMAERDLTTVQLVRREGPATFSVRDPFPVGGVVEDPATGAAAAAFGAYLRALGLVEPPATVTLHQGDDLGRPSLLAVTIPPGDAGIEVTGAAVRLPA